MNTDNSKNHSTETVGRMSSCAHMYNQYPGYFSFGFLIIAFCLTKEQTASIWDVDIMTVKCISYLSISSLFLQVV